MLSSKSYQVRKLAVILHADVVGSTELVQKNEVISHERIQNAFHRFSDIIGNYGGIAHEIRGDALVAEFGRASDSVCAALAFQNANSTFNKELTDEIQPEIRIGISLGEVVIADGTITGAGVVLAQRLEHLAKPNGVVVQATVSETVPIRLPFAFESLGEQKLKGFDQPVRAYTVQTKQGELVPEPELDDFAQGVATQHNEDSNRQILSDIGKPSIAVLPFDNLGGSDDQMYLADGIAEDLVTELSRYRSFLVVARNSSFTYRDSPLTVAEIGEELGVRYLVRGSVRIASDRVRVTVQLVQANSDRQLWAERYDRLMDDIFELQDEIIFSVVTMLEPQVIDAERARARRKPTETLDAWEAYQRGLWHIYQYTAENNAIGQELLVQATKIDANFASAYAGLAYSISLNRSMGYLSESSDYDDQVFDLAYKAIALDVNDALAHAAMGRAHLLKGEGDSAISNFERALELSPNHAVALQGLGCALCWHGQAEASLSSLDDALRRNPHNPIIWIVMEVKSLALIFTGVHEDALVWAKNGQRQTNAGIWPHVCEIVALINMDRTDDAKISLNELLDREPDFSTKFARQHSMIHHPPYLEHYLAGLHAAGLPES